MPKNKISEFSSTPANNTDIGGIDIAEGCAPSGINNAIRELMAQLKDMITGADGDSQVVGGNLSVTGTSAFTGAVTATGGVIGNLTGNVTGNVTGSSGSCTGNAANVTGTVAVANGGTGLATLTANNVMLGNGTSAPSFVAPSTNGNVLTSNGTTWTSATPATINQSTLMTAQATTSGTSKDFTGIPSWVKRITVMFQGVSTSGTSVVQIQLGAGSVTTSGYLGSNTAYAGSGTGSAANLTTGFGVGNFNSASNVRHGALILNNISGNIWSCNGVIALSDSAGAGTSAGTISLGGTLDRVRITTINGIDTFDAGSVNVMYE